MSKAKAFISSFPSSFGAGKTVDGVVWHSRFF